MSDTAVMGSAVKKEPSNFLRWTALVLISLAMFGNYYIYDSISPLADLLKEQLGFSDSNIGLLNAIYSFPNIIMVLIGGLIIDRIGTRKSVVIFTVIIMIGALVTALQGNLFLMATGRLIFGLGAESMIVAITTIIARWFKGKELSFAFGINLTVARLGSFLALNSPTIAKSYFDNWHKPLMITVVSGVFALVCILFYYILDVYATKKYDMPKDGSQDKVELKGLFKFGKSFWFITALCVTFYSAMFPFQTFAIKLFMHNHFVGIPTGIARSMGGFLSSLLTLSAMILTPLFGLLSDKIGKRSILMMFGSFIIIPVYLIMVYSHGNDKIPTELLDKVNAKEETVKEMTSNINEYLSNFESNNSTLKNAITDQIITSDSLKLNTSKFYSEIQFAKEKIDSLNNYYTFIVEHSRNNIMEKIKEYNLENKFDVKVINNQLLLSDLKPLSILQQFKVFLELLKILFMYFPNLVIPMLIMGIAFSLIPAVMWPSVALVVKEEKLGTAYGLMTMIQNIGLFGFNLMIGWANDFSGASASNPNGYRLGMWIFSTLGFLGLFFAFMLRRQEMGPNAHGLELSAAEKKAKAELNAKA